jgi:hypothetical protein
MEWDGQSEEQAVYMMLRPMNTVGKILGWQYAFVPINKKEHEQHHTDHCDQ